ncbi:MAG: beta strand repeat-containing protein, partial [Casimicrobium sp.]
TITAIAGTPQGALVTKDYTTPLRALVRDNLSNPMTGIVVTFTPPTGAANASVTFPSGNTAVTGVDGQASVVVRANAVGGAFVVNATVPNVATAAPFALTNTPPVPTSIVATGGTPQSSTVTTNYASALEATVRDTLGNPSSGVLVTFTVPTGSGIASATFSSGNTATTDAQGKARVNVTANSVVGAFVVNATAAGVSDSAAYNLSNLAPTTASITATAGTPQNALVGKDYATTLQATVKDNLGNPVSGVVVAFAAPSSGASVTFPSGNTASTNAQGQASVAVRANTTAGSSQVTATTAGVNGSATFALTNSAAVPTTITASAGTPQSATVTTQYSQQLEATVLDTLGNAANGVLVTFAAPNTAGSATVTFPAGNTSTTDTQGRARVAVKANDTIGAVTVIATAVGVTGDARFALTNTAPAVASVIATSGTPQTARIGSMFGQSLVATVRNSLNAPVSGITVTFVAPSAGASVTFPNGNTALTNASGEASVQVKANANAGSFNVVASAAGATGNAIFGLTTTAACQPANSVVFGAIKGAAMNSLVTSNTVTISG